MAALSLLLAIIGASVVADLVVENTAPAPSRCCTIRSPATAMACCWP
jgi:hypothetical protein